MSASVSQLFGVQCTPYPLLKNGGASPTLQSISLGKGKITQKKGKGKEKNGFLIPPAQDWGLYKKTTPPTDGGAKHCLRLPRSAAPRSQWHFLIDSSASSRTNWA